MSSSTSLVRLRQATYIWLRLILVKTVADSHLTVFKIFYCGIQSYNHRITSYNEFTFIGWHAPLPSLMIYKILTIFNQIWMSLSIIHIKFMWFNRHKNSLFLSLQNFHVRDTSAIYTWHIFILKTEGCIEGKTYLSSVLEKWESVVDNFKYFKIFVYLYVVCIISN